MEESLNFPEGDAPSTWNVASIAWAVARTEPRPALCLCAYLLENNEIVLSHGI